MIDRKSLISNGAMLLFLSLSLRSMAQESETPSAESSTVSAGANETIRPRREDVAWPWKSDPDFLEKRNEAIEELRQYGRVHITNSRSERTNWLVHTFEGTPTDDVLQQTLPFIPELKRIEMNPKRVSAEGFAQLAQLEYLEYLFLNAEHKGKKTRVDITKEEIAQVAQIPALRTLSFHGCSVTDDELAHLKSLATLQRFGIRNTALTANCFRTIAKWPRIKSVSCTEEAFDQPIDRETRKAIASLNGRVTSLYFGEWDSMALDPSLISAIGEIKSLTDLWIGKMGHLTAEQIEPLTTLPNLVKFDYETARGKEHKDVLDRIRMTSRKQ